MNSPIPETRASLLIRLQDVDEVDAWETFLALYSPVVYRTARRLNLQAADAENVVQEVLPAVSRSIGQWLQRDDRGSFRAWLLRIARNKAIDVLTHRSTRPFHNGDVSHLGAPKLSSICESTASNSLDDEYRWELFSQAAKEVQKVVTAQTWDAFWMTTVEGVSIEDAAGRLNVRTGVIYLSRCRVIERIKRIVKEWEGESWS